VNDGKKFATVKDSRKVLPNIKLNEQQENILRKKTTLGNNLKKRVTVMMDDNSLLSILQEEP